MRKISRKTSLRARMTVLVMVELAATVAFTTFFSNFFHVVFGKSYNPPRMLELMIIGLVISATITQFLGRWFFDPIKKQADGVPSGRANKANHSVIGTRVDE